MKSKNENVKDLQTEMNTDSIPVAKNILIKIFYILIVISMLIATFFIGVGLTYEKAYMDAGKLDINKYVNQCNLKIRECKQSCGGMEYFNLSNS